MHASDDTLRALFGTPMDRRRFLKRSASGLVLLGVGAVLPAGCRRYPKAEVPLRFFTAKEYAIVNAVAERLLGVPGRVGASEEQIDVAMHVDTLVATWDADAQGQLRTMLRVFEHGTTLFDLQRKRFTRLAAEQQDQYIAGWMSSTLGARRIVFRALKALTAGGFYQDPRTWARLGYDGPWLGRVFAAARIEPEASVLLGALRPSGR